MTARPIDIASLDPAERLRLIEELWDSLSADPDAVPLTEAQRQELDRRLDSVDSGNHAGIPWEELLGRLRTPMP